MTEGRGRADRQWFDNNHDSYRICVMGILEEPTDTDEGAGCMIGLRQIGNKAATYTVIISVMVAGAIAFKYSSTVQAEEASAKVAGEAQGGQGKLEIIPY